MGGNAETSQHSHPSDWILVWTAGPRLRAARQGVLVSVEPPDAGLREVHTPVVDRFRLDGKRALLTGGGGVLGAALARSLAEAGAHILITDLVAQRAEQVAEALCRGGYRAEGLALDAMSHTALVECAARVGRVDILVNAAGGNVPAATTSAEQSFFDLPREGLEQVLDLNLFAGAILPSQAFGRAMVACPTGGVILNISSMNALRPLTRIPGYSAAKAAVSNFTQWLAVHMAREYNPRIRVNALAPGFILTEQNRFLLTDSATGALTPRGHAILEHTPMGRFGEPADLAGAAVWLCSDAAAFVTGIVLPIDGGFSAFSGV